MDAFEPNNRSEITDVTEDAEYRHFLADPGQGLLVVAEAHGPDDERVHQPDAGDFVKWIRAERPDIRLTIQEGRRLVLRSSDVWIPLVFLATDIALPVYLNLVSSYLYARFKSALRNEAPRVHLSAEYIDGASGSVKRFNFEGNHEALKAAIKRLDLNEFFDG